MNEVALQNSISDYDQRTFIKFCVLLNKPAREIRSLLLNALGKRAYPYSTVTRWVRIFKNESTSIEEARGGGHNVHLKKEERINKIKKCLDERRDWSVRELALSTGVPKSSNNVQLVKND